MTGDTELARTHFDVEPSALSRPIVHSDLSGPFIGSLVSPESQVQLLLSTHELTSSQTLAS